VSIQQQRSLFDSVRRPAATADPETSHTAAIRLQRSGRLGKQAMKTLRALAAYLDADLGEPTSYELAGGSIVLRHLYGRRLPDLEKRHLVEKGAARPCRITQERSHVWRVTDKGRALLESQR
jgi:hypothetical protein